MGFFDKMKKQSNGTLKKVGYTPPKPEQQQETQTCEKIKKGIVNVFQNDINSSNYNQILREYIAFDTETTGLRPDYDRIVELGAIWFKEGKPEKRFSSLVNPKIPINPSASDVNGITDTMLENAPPEEVIYPQFLEFLGDALKGDVYMVAHNASFDFKFLRAALERLGYSGSINYIDTLKISRKLLGHQLPNHKQGTIEEYFGLHNEQGHRASSDAKVCGHILWKFLEIMKKPEEGIVLAESGKSTPLPRKSIISREEYEICAVIQKIISDNGGDTSLFYYEKNSNNYITVYCPFNVLKFKNCKKGKYLIVKADEPEVDKFVTEPCTLPEGGSDFIRVYFSNPFELIELSNFINQSFVSRFESWLYYKKAYPFDAAACIPTNPNSISESFLELLLDTAKKREYPKVNASDMKKQTLKRSDVSVKPIHSRIPPSEIENANDWDKGFKEGCCFWDLGEQERKKKNFDDALKLYDIARAKGYLAPVLYKSYAKVYRKLKDYENEIDILDEALEREPYGKGWYETRRNTAIELLWKVQNK